MRETDKLLSAVQKLDDVDPDEQLVSAMRAACRKKPDRSLFSNFFQKCRRELNVAEVVGVLKWMLSLRTSCAKQQTAAVGALKFLIGRGIPTKWVAHWKIAQPGVDALVFQMLRSHRNSKESDKKFIALNRSKLNVLCAPADLEQVLNCGENYMEVEQQLLSVVHSSECLRALFSKESIKVVEQKCLVHINTHLQKCFDFDGLVTVERMDTAKAELLAVLEVESGIDQLPVKRAVKMTCFGQDIVVKVDSLSDEVDLHFSRVLKGMAVAQDKLTHTFAEVILASNWQKPTHKGRITVEAVVFIDSARSRLATAYSDADIKKCDQLLRLVNGQTARLCCVESGFKIEMAFVSLLCTSSGAGALLTMIKQAFPSAIRQCTALQTVTALQALQTHSCHKLSSEQAQKQLQIAINLASAIVDKREPSLTSGRKDAFLADLLARSSWFLSRKTGEDTQYGQQALVDMYQHSVAAVKKKSEPVKEYIDCMRCFTWLVPDELKTAVAEMLASYEDVIVKSKVGGTGGKKITGKTSSAASSSGAAAVGGGEKASEEALSIKHAVSMFR